MWIYLQVSLNKDSCNQYSKFKLLFLTNNSLIHFHVEFQNFFISIYRIYESNKLSKEIKK